MMTELDVEKMKIQINEFLFMHLPGTTTLDDMELIALDILEIIIKHYGENEKSNV